MSKFYFFLIFFLQTLSLLAQNVTLTPFQEDSLLKITKSKKEDTNKVKALNRLGLKYVWNDPKKAIEYSLPALSLSQRLNYLRGEISANYVLGESFAVSGNYTESIKLKFRNLQLAEQLGDQNVVGRNFINIAATYFYQGDNEQTIRYARKAMQVPEFFNQNKFNQERAYGFLGEAYFKLNRLDSALYYIQRAYELDLELDRHWSVPYFYLAHIHAARKHYELALQFLRIGLSHNPPKKDVIDGHLGIANVFFQMNRSDSALFYARKAIEEGNQFGFQAEVADATALATKIFKQQGMRDSAFRYQELMLQAKDSLFGQEKMRAVQNLTFNEQLRQLEIESKKIKEHEERNRNIQYVIIALTLLTFIILFFILSHSIIANQRLIKFLGILSLLMVFEFINLFIHPYLDKWTNHSIPMMLGCMICIAALLIPLHHKLEHWITHKMVEKNKKIRLAAAKKTIAQLEKANPE